MSNDLHIQLAGENVILLPERALYWPRESVLLMTDPHWGKAATFRAKGLPLPEGSVEADLQRLSAALQRTGAVRLICLGDLLHAKAGRDASVVATVGNWREAHAALEVLLVRGNHDRSAGDPPDTWKIHCVDAPFTLAPFILHHEPPFAENQKGQTSSPALENAYALGGHLHPLALLSGKGRQMLKLPCFWLGQRVGVLPAFGEFTAGMVVQPAPGDRLYAVAGESVVQVR
jgi:uncharacterized protein